MLRTTTAGPHLRGASGSAHLKLSPYLYISPFFILFAIVTVSLIIPSGCPCTAALLGQVSSSGSATSPLPTDRFFWTCPQHDRTLLPPFAVDRGHSDRGSWTGTARRVVLADERPAALRGDSVATALIFSSIFGVPTGLVNNIVGVFGVEAIEWKRNVMESHLAIATMVNWRWTGYNALILLAAMQAVPRELHEAAVIDGASAVRRFFSVTLPSIRPTFIFVLVTATIGGLQIFAEPRLFDVSNAGGIGGSDRQFQTTVLYLWEMAFFRQNLGRAAAIAWLLFLLIVLIGLVNVGLSRGIATAGENRTRRKRRFWPWKETDMTATRAPSPSPSTPSRRPHATAAVGDALGWIPDPGSSPTG